MVLYVFYVHSELFNVLAYLSSPWLSSFKYHEMFVIIKFVINVHVKYTVEIVLA